MNEKSLREKLVDRLDRWTFDAAQSDSGDSQPHLDLTEGALTLKVLTAHPPKEDKKAVLLASPAIIEIISSWRTHPIPTAAIGALEDETDGAQTISRLIRDDVAFVLMSKSKDRVDSSPIAFATARQSPIDPSVIEIGKLLVKEELRARRVGSAMIINIARAVLISVRKAQLIARVWNGNKRGLDMFSEITPFSPKKLTDLLDKDVPLDSLEKYAYEHETFTWYRWIGTQSSDRTPFGQVLKELRDSRGLTQQLLSQRAEISRESLNLIERGGNPGSESLGNLIYALDKSKELGAKELTRLVFASAGMAPPHSLIFPSESESLVKRRIEESKWYLSDRPPEVWDTEHFSESVSAILNGFSRFFLVPRGVIHVPYAMPLVRRLFESLEDDLLTEEAMAKALPRIRLFTAPPALCRLRIHVLGAEIDSWRNIPATTVTIGSHGQERFDVDAAQAMRLFDDVADCIRPGAKAAPLSVDDTLKLEGGFELISLRKIYPELFERIRSWVNENPERQKRFL